MIGHFARLHASATLLSVSAVCAQADLGPAVIDSVVRIEVRNAGGTEIGAGFFISPDGDIATAYHVIEGAGRIYVRTNYGHGEARVIRFDESIDLAVLKLQPLGKPWPYLQIGETPDPLRGTAGVAVGHPGNKLNFSVPVYFTREPYPSEQWISGGNYIFRRVGLYLLPLDGAIEQGMSGGPVIVRGRVVGVISGSERGTGAGEFGWAIPASHLGSLKRFDLGMTLPEQKLLHASARQRTRALLKASATTEPERYALLRNRFLEQSAALQTTRKTIERTAKNVSLCIDRLQRSQSSAAFKSAADQCYSNESQVSALGEIDTQLERSTALTKDLNSEMAVITQKMQAQGPFSKGLSKEKRKILDSKMLEFRDAMNDEDQQLVTLIRSMRQKFAEFRSASQKAAQTLDSSARIESLQLILSIYSLSDQLLEAHFRHLFAHLGYLSNVSELIEL